MAPVQDERKSIWTQKGDNIKANKRLLHKYFLCDRVQKIRPSLWYGTWQDRGFRIGKDGNNVAPFDFIIIVRKSGSTNFKNFNNTFPL